MVFPWNLSESKSSQVSRTFLSILADLSNVVARMVPIFPPISISSLFFYPAFGDHSKGTIYNWYEHHPYVLQLLSTLARSNYLSVASPSSIFDIAKQFYWLYYALLLKEIHCPIGWGCRIHRLLLCIWVRPSNECPVLTLNNLIVRFQ